MTGVLLLLNLQWRLAADSWIRPNFRSPPKNSSVWPTSHVTLRVSPGLLPVWPISRTSRGVPPCCLNRCNTTQRWGGADISEEWKETPTEAILRLCPDTSLCPGDSHHHRPSANHRWWSKPPVKMLDSDPYLLSYDLTVFMPMSHLIS